MRSKSGRTGTHTSPGPWAQLVAVDAICPDGKIRRIRVGTPDTMWSAPGRTRVAGVNVSGSVYLRGDYDEHELAGEWLFSPNRYAKNCEALRSALAARGIDLETWSD